jgi:hypothetical protein
MDLAGPRHPIALGLGEKARLFIGTAIGHRTRTANGGLDEERHEECSRQD